MRETIVKMKGLISPKDVTAFSYESTAQSYLLVCIFILALLSTEIQKAGLWLFPILAALLAASFILGIRFFAHKNHSADKTFRSEIEYDFTTTGINITTRNGSSFVPWEQIHQVIVSKKLFTIYVAKKQAFLLPQTWFSNEAERVNFKKILVSHLAENKIKQKFFYVW